MFTSVDAPGGEKLLGAEDSQRVALLAAEQILAPFAAGQGQVGGAHVQSAGKIGQKRRIFVIGMSSDHHDAAECIQALQGLANLDRPGEIPLSLYRAKQGEEEKNSG